jgi:hypothetical protein
MLRIIQCLLHCFVVVCEQDIIFYLLHSWDIVQVIGAHFERHGSKPFAVYTIQVRDTEDRTWRIQRRYSWAQANFSNVFISVVKVTNFSVKEWCFAEIQVQ